MTRVSSGTLTVVVFAMLAGLAGAFIVRQRLVQPPPSLPPLAEQEVPNNILVPVAAMDIQPGRSITRNDIVVRQFTPKAFAQSEFAKLPFMRSSQQIQTRKLKVGVKKGEPFLTESFYPDGSGPGIAEMLEEGFRAVTIPIEHISAVQGFARPGSYVDVLFRSTKDADRPEVTITLLERVQVMAVNTNTLAENSVELEQGGTVTLAVTPHQAKDLKVVEGRGELSLTLRHPDDQLDFLPVDLNRGEGVRNIAGRENQGLHPVNRREPNDPRNIPWWNGMERITRGTDQVSLDDLLNIPPKKEPAKMVIYHGGSKQVVTFDNESQPQPRQEPELIRIPVERPFVRESNPNLRTVQFPSRQYSPGS